MADITLSDFQKYLVPNYGTPPILIKKAKGVELTGENGKKFIDLASGIAVSALGHCNKDLVDALSKQSKKLWHVSNTLASEPSIKLAQELIKRTFAEQVFFANSGAEANEAAIKLARRVSHNRFGSYKNEIICFDGAFHGRTLLTVTAGSRELYKKGFGPLPGGFKHIPFNEIETFKKTVSDSTCAVLVEPVQGEGGVIPIVPKFLLEIRNACNQHNASLIIDEVQTGMGRTGSLFAYQGLEVVPDILTLAKSLGCGFPISAMLTTNALSSHFSPGTHGSTFGGNPLGCAVANRAIELIDNQKFLENVKLRGDQLQNGLKKINQKYQVFSAIRGSGLLIGAVMNQSFKGKSALIVKAGHKEGIIMLTAGDNVLRFAPPLLISSKYMERALNKLERAIKLFVKTEKNSC